MTAPLNASFRAELVRVAARFCAPRGAPRPTGMPLDHLRLEPRPAGGAVIVAANAADLIVAVDPSAEISRPATIRLDERLIKAADGLRKTGASHRLSLRGGRAYVDGLNGLIDESAGAYLDWRRLLAFLEHNPAGLAPRVRLSAASHERIRFVAEALERAAGAGPEAARQGATEIEPGPGALALVRFPVSPDVIVLAYEHDETAPIARVRVPRAPDAALVAEPAAARPLPGRSAA